MKKKIVWILALTMLSACGCSDQKNVNSYSSTKPTAATAETTADATETTSAAATDVTGETASSDTTTSIVKQHEPPAGKTDTLVNNMSDNEKAKAGKRSLTLLDTAAQTEYKVAIQFSYADPEYMLEMLDDHKLEMEEAQYEKAHKELEELQKKGEDYKMISVVTINDRYYSGLTPNLDYDGGEIDYKASDGADVRTYKYNSMEEYFEALPKQLKDSGASDSSVESIVKQTKLVFDAIMNKTYEEIPEGTINMREMPANFWDDPFIDFSNTWEFDRDAVSAIKDQIDEYTFYDDTLATDFLVHVVRPPHYDKNKTYPVLFLTDGVWRFGDTPALYKLMEEGKAADVLLVSLGYGYRFDGTNDFNRFIHLLEMRDDLLRFITDNVMPYLGEQYHIDCANSTLYGHSNGGVFTHNALFKADQYENQPFGRYIIGSPAFWALYDEDYPDLDPTGFETDYGYFDRFEVLNKKVFLCGGSQEDPDYQDKYNGHASTLEGLKALNDRLKANGVDVEYKLYDSHHSQYIPDMLKEYLQKEYPAN
ncbi:MAG: hypothetical protein IK130_07940 [Oscillospiraceae bacterium]|nr:hypothetical protein [Oscillospiraceae bacterium]